MGLQAESPCRVLEDVFDDFPCVLARARLQEMIARWNSHVFGYVLPDIDHFDFVDFRENDRRVLLGGAGDPVDSRGKRMGAVCLDADVFSRLTQQG